jgi:S-adenosylmethionine:diacylglycerol 3-amino-3-carboxypropyl transferase
MGAATGQRHGQRKEQRVDLKAQKDDLAFWQDGSLGQTGASDKNERILFGHVREDANVELALLKLLPEAKRAFVIASGGCTALSILAQTDCHVDAVDINKAQIYLCELKSRALQTLSLEDARRFCLQNASTLYTLYGPLKDKLSPQTASFFENNRQILAAGLNNSGLIDQRLATLVKLFYLSVHPKKRVEKFLLMDNPEQQLLYFNKYWDNWQWRLALNIAFSKSFLSLGFGKAAIDALPENLTETMTQRLQRAFTKFPNRTNRFLWETMLSDLPTEVEERFPIYLQKSSFANVQNGIAHGKINWHHADAVAWLKEQESHSIDFFGLSNILEIVKSDYGKTLSEEIARTAKSGAVICVRAIFPGAASTAPILSEASRRLIYDQPLSQELQAIDQSMFCNFIQIFRASP